MDARDRATHYARVLTDLADGDPQLRLWVPDEPRPANTRINPVILDRMDRVLRRTRKRRSRGAMPGGYQDND